jgi:hypothetical protein
MRTEIKFICRVCVDFVFHIVTLTKNRTKFKYPMLNRGIDLLSSIPLVFELVIALRFAFSQKMKVPQKQKFFSFFLVRRRFSPGLRRREGETSCGRRGAKDQEPGGLAGRDSDEEAGDQAEALRGTRDHHGPGEGGPRVPATAAHSSKSCVFTDWRQ